MPATITVDEAVTLKRPPGLRGCEKIACLLRPKEVSAVRAPSSARAVVVSHPLAHRLTHKATALNLFVNRRRYPLGRGSTTAPSCP